MAHGEGQYFVAEHRSNWGEEDLRLVGLEVVDMAEPPSFVVHKERHYEATLDAVRLNCPVVDGRNLLLVVYERH